MFKIGDIVTLKINHIFADVEYNLNYVVYKRTNNEIMLKNLTTKERCGNREGFESYPYPSNLFKLVKIKALTEIDYLDAFQENFKEGV